MEFSYRDWDVNTNFWDLRQPVQKGRLRFEQNFKSMGIRDCTLRPSPSPHAGPYIYSQQSTSSISHVSNDLS